MTEENKLIHELGTAKNEADALYAELRDAYQELKETQDELVRQEKLVATGELAAAVAHEIRNPLSIINMSVQYIHGKLGPEDPLREFTEAIIEKVTRVDRITKELIDYGRPRELALRTVDIQRVIDSVLRLAAARARSQGVDIRRNLSRHLPLVRMDVERMDEVFSNLITNALDAMPEGGHLTAAIREDPDGNRVVVEIANTGKGISPRKRAQLFTPFFTTKPDGTGLGLAICQRIVDEHHGSISAESKISGPNKGTRFIVTLPIASPEKEPSPVKAVGEPLLTQKAN
jgi:two-component system sensor histidine kinase HydH